MKTTIILNELVEVSFDAARVERASAPVVIESSPSLPTASGHLGEDFREMLHRRSITPFVSAIPHFEAILWRNSEENAEEETPASAVLVAS